VTKRALVVGIDHFTNPDWRLQGCGNDAEAMRGLLTTHFGFGGDEVRVLRDRAATAQGIRDGLDWLLGDYAGDGTDVRVFHLASHGTQVPDDTDDEWEAKDEVIVPHDHDFARPFRDDDLRVYFDAVPDNVHLVFVADCCHSGTIQRGMFDLGPGARPRYLVPPPDVVDRIAELEARRNAEADDWAARELDRMRREVEPDEWYDATRQYIAQLRGRFRENKYGVTAAPRHVLLAACEDRQSAADAPIDGVYRGAFTWSLGKAVAEAGTDLSYGDLIVRAGMHLRGFDQRPQLECPPHLRDARVFAPLA
jgi:metacaspase-1